jgi:hypothetical protein
MSQMPMESAVDESDLESRAGGWSGGDSHHAGHLQASMFDEPPAVAGLEADDSTYERVEEPHLDEAELDVADLDEPQLDEPSYDSIDDFSQESMETDLEDVMEQEATSFEAQELAGNPLEHEPAGTGTSEPAPGALQPVEQVAPTIEQPVAAIAQTPLAHAPVEDASATHDSKSEPQSPAEHTAAEPASANGEISEPQHVTVLTADDFAALEDRILRAVSLVKREREARVAAESQVAALEAHKAHQEMQTQAAESQVHLLEAQVQALEAQLREHQAEHQAQSPVLERLEREVDSLRTEREQVRQRVERLLGQLDALEL